MKQRIRAWWRRTMNLDGPWWCVSCGTRTVVRQDGAARCILCGLAACNCGGGWGEEPDSSTCEHHGTPQAILDAEALALALSERN